MDGNYEGRNIKVMVEKKKITEGIEKDVASQIALLAFGTDEDLFVKQKSSFVEIRVQREAQILQIQENGTMLLLKKENGGNFSRELCEIPNCFQIVQLLINKNYTL